MDVGDNEDEHHGFFVGCSIFSIFGTGGGILGKYKVAPWQPIRPSAIGEIRAGIMIVAPLSPRIGTPRDAAVVAGAPARLSARATSCSSC